MTQELNNNKNDNSIQSRRGQRTFRISRGVFSSQELLNPVSRQDDEGGEQTEHVLFHKLGTLEPVLLSEPQPNMVFRGRGSYRANQRYLASSDDLLFSDEPLDPTYKPLDY